MCFESLFFIWDGAPSLGFVLKRCVFLRIVHDCTMVNFHEKPPSGILFLELVPSIEESQMNIAHLGLWIAHTLPIAYPDAPCMEYLPTCTIN